MDNTNEILQELRDIKATQQEQGKKLDGLETGRKAVRGDISGLHTKVDGMDTKVDRLKDHALHTNTALKALPPRGEVEEIVDTAVNAAKNEINANILNLDAKVSRKLRSHNRRIENIEEHDGIENPEKN